MSKPKTNPSEQLGIEGQKLLSKEWAMSINGLLKVINDGDPCNTCYTYFEFFIVRVLR